jgi:hypothetical protein
MNLLSYTIGYEFCVDAANIDAYKGLLIEVQINQDYIEVSHVLYLHTLKAWTFQIKRRIIQETLHKSSLGI